ncbi:hypothetical protein [Chthonobacter albigriseus]|uniref:hypothetical protein n=1 Tax=Chthonobacter albigriseus TaxID=1683161 RepID=UPI0015EE8495|nr:hypothetical protein [Chthonobacter albigriseus]
MRKIEIEPGLTVCFPGRGAEFDEGIEVGLALVELASSPSSFTRMMSFGAAEQIRTVAPKLGFRTLYERPEIPGEPVDVTFERQQPEARRSHLRLVTSG